ncbi:MAG: YfhO family protein [Ruminococcus sp.]|nr:YfhO family protein [Ruminococcus sp.]
MNKNIIKSAFKTAVPAFTVFLICCLLFLIYFAISGLYPFGDRSIVWCDFEQQYLPLLLEFKNILETGGSLLLGKGGGGMNLWGVFLFFISSPFSLLSLSVDESQMMNFMNILTMLKLASCGFTASLFFKVIHKQLPTIFNIILSLMYCFCGYGMTYYQNNMWLDMMCLFPILLLSLYRLSYTGKYGLYTICLTLSMALNFYLSFMNIIFIILGFGIISYCCSPKHKKGEISLKFIIGSAIAAIMSAVIWIPALIQFTSSGRSDSAIALFAQNSFFAHFSDKFVLYSCTAIILAAILLIFLKRKLFSNNIPKSIAILFILTFLGSFIDPINKLWHTGSYQAYPLRYGYIVIFLGLNSCAVLLVSKRRSNKKIPSKKYIMASLVISGFIFVLYGLICIFGVKKINSYVSTLWTSNSDTVILSVLAIITAAAYTSIILFKRHGKINTMYASLFISMIFIAESFFNTNVYMGNVHDNGERYQNTIEISQRLHDHDFFRLKTKKFYFYSNMSEAMGFNTISHYTSLNDSSFFYTLKRLGYSSYWLDSSSHGGTVLTDAFLMNKYLIGTSSNTNKYFTPLDSNGTYKIYENTILPDGALISKTNPKELMDFNSYTRLYTTKYMSEKLLNKEQTVLEYVPYKCENIEYRHDHDKFSLKIIDNKKPAYLEYSFLITDKKELYFDVFSNYSTNLSEPYYNSVKIYLNNVLLENNYPNKKNNGILDLGTFENRYINIRVELKKDIDVSSFGVYSLDAKEISSALNEAQTAHIQLNGNTITVYSEDDGYVYLPFSYNKGYTARLDGKKCEIHKALGSFMAVKVKAGSTLLLKFYPVGWKIGLFASIIGLAAFILLLIKDKKLTFSQKTYKIADKALLILFISVFVIFYILSILFWLVLQF